jgi:hypothetical protein
MTRTFISLHLAAVLFLSMTIGVHADSGDARSNWTVSPEQPGEGLAGPRNDKGHNGEAHLGQNEKKDGDPHSFVEKKIKCGTGGEWCTTELLIGFYQADEEWLKLTLTGADGNSTSVFVKDPTNATKPFGELNSRAFTVSTKGCKECTIKAEIVKTAKSKSNNIKSIARIGIHSSFPICTEKSAMNVEGKLVDEKGKAVPRGRAE